MQAEKFVICGHKRWVRLGQGKGAKRISGGGQMLNGCYRYAFLFYTTFEHHGVTKERIQQNLLDCHFLVESPNGPA